MNIIIYFKLFELYLYTILYLIKINLKKVTYYVIDF